MNLKLKPLGTRVLVEPAADTETKKGLIIIPDVAREKPTQAIVRAIGDGPEIPVKVGDRVLVSKYAGTEIKLDGKEFGLVMAEDILAIVG